MSSALLSDDAGIDVNADQRGRIIGSCVAIFIITDIFVLLRLVSRKLARAGYWVRIALRERDRGLGASLMIWSSGMTISPSLRW